MHKAFRVAPVVVSAIAKIILTVIENHTGRWAIAILRLCDATDNAYHPIAAVSFVAALNLYLVSYLYHVRLI